MSFGKMKRSLRYFLVLVLPLAYGTVLMHLRIPRHSYDLAAAAVAVVVAERLVFDRIDWPYPV